MSDVEKAAVIRAIRRLAEENGGVPVGQTRFVAETGMPLYLFRGGLWANWGDAVSEAGYVPRQLQQQIYDDDDLLRYLAELTRQVRRLPSLGQRRMAKKADPTFPNSNVIEKRLGNTKQQIDRLRDFIERTPEFADVASLLPDMVVEALAKLPEETDDPDAAQPVPGYVYLVRSGKFHKIGRSNDHGRRSYEIGLQLPEKLEVVHTIGTDDAVGIERYWHERFRDRRRNGEWFELTKADVAAFKRRRLFM
ncbi:GIY-YIG nuclease family protein [Mycobacterium rhizamassiliense]|nr:GIY-YIG nuclease family protein [Mycobacterium rhizamassiliense]